jgi:outer membrane receptor protein involved in Fe transport
MLPNAPKVTASLGFNYVQSVENLGEAVLNLTANYRSSALPQFDPTPTMPAFTLVNAQLIFTPTASPWKITLYGKNLLDARYWVFAETTGIGPTIAWIGRPREFGARLAYKF